jgi:hypothetical protein
MGHPLKLLVFQRLLNGANLSCRGGRTARYLADAEDAKGTDFESGRVGIFRFRGRPDLPTESRLNNGLEGGLPTDSKALGLHQKVIGKNERRFHKMAANMVIWLTVNPSLFSG